MNIEYLVAQLCIKLIEQYHMSFAYLNVRLIQKFLNVNLETSREIMNKLRELKIINENNYIDYHKVVDFLMFSPYYGIG